MDFQTAGVDEHLCLCFFQRQQEAFPLQTSQCYCDMEESGRSNSQSGCWSYRSPPAGINLTEVGGDVDVVKSNVPSVPSEVVECPVKEEQVKGNLNR